MAYLQRGLFVYDKLSSGSVVLKIDPCTFEGYNVQV